MNQEVIDKLEYRARIIGALIKKAYKGKQWSSNYYNDWKNINPWEQEVDADVPEQGKVVFKFGEHCSVTFENIQPSKIEKQILHTPVMGDSQKLDVSTYVINNDSDCEVEESYEYSVSSERSVSTDVGVEVSIGISQTIGYGGAVVTGETTVETSVTSSFNKAWEETNGKSRTSTRVISVPPKTRAYITQQLFKGSFSQKCEYWAGLEHTISVWSNKDFTFKWNSLQQLIDTIKGQSPNDVHLGEWFREKEYGHVDVSWFSHKLEEPCQVYYATTVNFDSATSGDMKITSKKLSDE